MISHGAVTYPFFGAVHEKSEDYGDFKLRVHNTGWIKKDLALDLSFILKSMKLGTKTFLFKKSILLL